MFTSTPNNGLLRAEGSSGGGGQLLVQRGVTHTGGLNVDSTVSTVSMFSLSTEEDEEVLFDSKRFYYI